MTASTKGNFSAIIELCKENVLFLQPLSGLDLRDLRTVIYQDCGPYMASITSNINPPPTSTSENEFETTVEHSTVHAIGYASDVVNTTEQAVRDMYLRLQRNVAKALQNMFQHRRESDGGEDGGVGPAESSGASAHPL